MRRKLSGWTDNDERGIGIILVLLSILILTVLTAGIVLTAGKEVYSSYNYRIDSQSLYVAEAGLQKAVNWFKSNYQPYGTPSAYNLAVSPVRLTSNSKIVQLDGIKLVYDYPDTTVVTAFQNNLVNQTLTVLTTPPLSGSFTVSARLSSARSVTVASGTTLLERWLITSQGKAGGGIAEASVVLTRFVQGLPSYAALACATGPASLTVGDLTPPITASINSYDSALGAYGGSNVGSQGNLATNGDLHMDGGAVNGNVSYASTSGSGTITGTSTVVSPAYDCSTIPLPTTSPGTTNVTINTATPYTLDPAVAPFGNYGNVVCTSSCNLTLNPGTYNMNALEVDSGSTIHITGPTVVNIVGTAALPSSGKALYLGSGTVANSAMIPSNLMIFVNRTDPVTADSGTAAAYVLIAPKSAVTNDSNTTFYGSIIGKTVYMDSGAQLHYDVALQRANFSLSPYTTISWNRGAF